MLISLAISVPCAFLSSLSAGQRDTTLVLWGLTNFAKEALGLPSPDVGAVDTVEVSGLGLKVVFIRLLRSARN